MWMWGASPEPGDWVKARKTIPATLIDALTGGGIPPGTTGVVTSKSGNRIDVDFATRYGTASVTTSASNCTIERRGGGVHEFRRRQGIITTVRIALAIFLLWPVAQFLIVFFWNQKSLNLDALPAALALAAIDSTSDLITAAVQEPAETVIYLGFTLILGKIAFGR